MLRQIAVLCCLLAFFRVDAQEIQTNEEPAVSELVRIWVAANRNKPTVSGWRVQVLSSADRAQAETAKSRFLTSFPDITALIVHERPNYKLRVGACKTRMEAMALIADLKDYYPGAYPAQDTQIPARDFLK